MDEFWLPTGHHWGLHIAHEAMEDSGPFTGGGHKVIWHTTEGRSSSGALATLKENRDAAHFVIDPYGNVAQCIPLNRAARALEHSGGPETNRANCIQIECVGLASETGKWSDSHYAHLAALFCLIDHRFPVRLHAPVSFAHPHRVSGQEFVSLSGHLGHCHVPGNSHSDPGPGFRWSELVAQVHESHRRYGK